MYDVFMSNIEDFPETKIEDIIRTTSVGIDLAPSQLDLVGVDPYLYRTEGRAGILRAALNSVSDRYDFILIDTPPSMGQLVINGLFAADHIIVTLDSGTFALDGVYDTFHDFWRYEGWSWKRDPSRSRHHQPVG